MKVLVLWHGAVEPAYRRLFDELASQGVSLSLMAPRRWKEAGRAQEFTPDRNAAYRSAALATAFTDHIRAFFYPNIFAVAREISSFRPDIIHIMEEPFSLAAYEIIKIKRLVRPGAKTILFSFENIDVRQRAPYSVFQSHNLKNSDAIVVVPEESIPLWRKRGFRGKIARIPLGIDTDIYRPARSKSARKKNTFTAGYAGRVVREKGLETVIEAMDRLDKKGLTFNLRIVGGGDNLNALSDLAKKYGFEKRVEFIGPMSQGSLAGFYGSLDLLLLPSVTTPQWKEQFGRVLPEAMACGTPVAGSSSGEIPNVIGEAGLVFRENDPGSLASCIERLMTDPSLCKRLTESGLKKAEMEYAWKVVAKKYLNLYSELTGRHEARA